jgi:DNA-binding MarR family transcriptional regulator
MTCVPYLSPDENGGMTQREIGAAMGVDPGILVGLLNPLEEEGLISLSATPATAG